MTDTAAALLRTPAREARALPHYAQKYRALDLSGDFDPATLPETTREDVTAAAAQAAARRRHRSGCDPRLNPAQARAALAAFIEEAA